MCNVAPKDQLPLVDGWAQVYPAPKVEMEELPLYAQVIDKLNQEYTQLQEKCDRVQADLDYSSQEVDWCVRRGIERDEEIFHLEKNNKRLKQIVDFHESSIGLLQIALEEARGN